MSVNMNQSRCLKVSQISHPTETRAADESHRVAKFDRSKGSRLVALAAILALMPGCRSGSTATETNHQEKKMTTLAISAIEDGTETRIGQITFDGTNNPTLTIERNGPKADKLKAVWDEASKRPSLPMQWTERTKTADDMISTRKSKEIPKGSDEYPNAVWSYLESGGNGFLVDKR